jgi:hypothetical protein
VSQHESDGLEPSLPRVSQDVGGGGSLGAQFHGRAACASAGGEDALRLAGMRGGALWLEHFQRRKERLGERGEQLGIHEMHPCHVYPRAAGHDDDLQGSRICFIPHVPADAHPRDAVIPTSIATRR